LMMPKNENLWYRVGYALESVRRRLPAQPIESGDAPASVKEAYPDVTNKVPDALMAVGAGSVATRIFSLWPTRSRPSLFRLFRGGAAGAAAAFLAELARPALSGKTSDAPLEEELTDILLAGAGRGLLYAALVEPRVPGPPLLQGATYGSLEYALTPWGGLGELAGSRAPQAKVPALAVLFKDRGTDEHLVEHIAFGVALALLYSH